MHKAAVLELNGLRLEDFLLDQVTGIGSRGTFWRPIAEGG